MPANPYRYDRPVTEDRGFVGRADLRQQIEAALSPPLARPIVVAGDRLLGKTSFLLHLGRTLPGHKFLPVYFDLMGCARRPAGEVIAAIGAAIAERAGLVLSGSAPDPEGARLRQQILPEAARILGAERRLVLLLDQIDLLDAATSRAEAPSDPALLLQLKRLVLEEPRLCFVFAVGAKECAKDVQALLEDLRWFRMGPLDERGARDLVLLGSREAVLLFRDEAVVRVLSLCAGHPYFLQLLCHKLFEGAYAGDPQLVQKIDVPAVDRTVARALSSATGGLDWLWAAFAPAERLILSTVARVTDERGEQPRAVVVDLLRQHSTPLPAAVIDGAIDNLLRREVLRAEGSALHISPELLRRWLTSRSGNLSPMPVPIAAPQQFSIPAQLSAATPVRPPTAVQVQASAMTPAQAQDAMPERLFQLARELHAQGDLETCTLLLRRALQQNQGLQAARLLLGQTLLDQGKTQDAISVLEIGHKDDPSAREPLAEALLCDGERRERDADDEGALLAYERVLSLFPTHEQAREQRTALWLRRADAAFGAADLDRALIAYSEAGSEAGVDKVKERQRRRELDALSAKAQQHLWQEEWDRAIDCYERLVVEEPEEGRFRDALSRSRLELDLSRLYTSARRALSAGDRTQALRDLGGILHQQPDYKDTAQLLLGLSGAKANPGTSPRPVLAPQPPRPALRGPLLLGLGLGALAGIFASAALGHLRPRGPQATPAPAVHPPTEAAAAAQRLLAADLALLGRRWDEALSHGERTLRTPGLSPELRQAAQAKLQVAEQEKRAQGLYGDLLQAAEKDESEAVMRLYRLLPGGSIYRELGKAADDKALRQFSAARLAEAQTARAAGRCGPTHYAVAQVLAVEPDNLLAREAQILPCKEAPKRPAAAAAAAKKEAQAASP